MHLLAHRLYDVSQPLEFTKCKEFDVAAVAKEKSGNLRGNWINKGNRFVGGKCVDNDGSKLIHL